MTPNPIDRRTALSLLAAAPLALNAGAVFGAVPPESRITVLYRSEGGSAPTRLDPVVQFASRALESQMLERGYRVIQASAEIDKLMDMGQSVIVTFAPSAGFSMVFSAYKNLRPVPGDEAGIAEVRLQAHVYVGRNVVAADDGRGQMYTKLTPGVREFGERRAMELAANRAAADLAQKVADHLQALSPDELKQWLAGPDTGVVVGQVGVPAQPPGVPEAVAQAAPPPLSPATAPAPAPAPAASPGTAPADNQPLPAPKARYALVVGMSSYASVRAAGIGYANDLPGVARDVTFVVESLKQVGFDDQHMVVLRDEKATGNAVRSAMQRFAGQLQPDDLLLMFISAHGMGKDGSYSGFGMPILADFRGPRGENGELDFWELQSLAKNMRGRVVWINDTCHSGGAAEGIATVVVGADGVKPGGDVRGPDATSVAKTGQPGQDFAIITASSPSEVSWETAQGGGLFTTRMFSALRQTGGKNPLGEVFVDNVQHAVIDESRKICAKQDCGSSHQQTPIFAYGGRGNLIRL